MILLALLATLSPALAAPTAQARNYIEARRGHAISSLNPLVARRTAGHDGEVVEWAGTLEGAMPTPPKAALEAGKEVAEPFVTLRTHSGDTFRVRVAGAGKWTPGKPVYVLARVVEQDGVLHHLNALAIAPTNDVTVAHEERMKKAMGSAPVAARGIAGAPGLSVRGAVQWILSFNRGMDYGTAQVLARSVLTSCAAYRVDARLALSLFAAESAFRHDAVSSAGAQGLGQLMPGTAAMLGVRNPFNPFENADASIRHLGDLLARWRGSRSQVEFALAAYNAGAGAVEQYGGIPPYAETIAYVKTILGYYSELTRYP
jgi:hypothetical protein